MLGGERLWHTSAVMRTLMRESGLAWSRVRRSRLLLTIWRLSVADPQASDDALLEKIARALMEVRAALPASDGRELPVLDLDPDFDDLPRDHTEGTAEDPVTREAVLRLAAAALRVIRESGG